MDTINNKNLPELKQDVNELTLEQNDIKERLEKIESIIEDTTIEEKLGEIISDNRARDQKIDTLERQIKEIAENSDTQNEHDKAALSSMFDELSTKLQADIEKKCSHTTPQPLNSINQLSIADEITLAESAEEIVNPGSSASNENETNTHKAYIDALLETPHPQQKSENINKDDLPQTKEDIMKIMSETVGLKNVTHENIRSWATHKSVSAINATNVDTFLYGIEFEEAHNNLAMRTIHYDPQLPSLRIPDFST